MYTNLNACNPFYPDPRLRNIVHSAVITVYVNAQDFMSVCIKLMIGQAGKLSNSLSRETTKQ